jgi:hypothetical protein
LTYNIAKELQLLKLRSLAQEIPKKSFGSCLFCSIGLTVSNIRFIRNPIDGKFVQCCIDDAKRIQSPFECPQCFIALTSQDKILEHMREHYGSSSNLPGYYSVKDFPTGGSNDLASSNYLKKNDLRQLLYDTYGAT